MRVGTFGLRNGDSVRAEQFRRGSLARLVGAAVGTLLVAGHVAAQPRAAQPANAGPSSAATGDASTSGATPEMRTLLVVRLEGALGEAREAALESLLRSELSSAGVEVSLARSDEPRLAWTARARRDRRVLVLGILDARDEGAWRLYVIDAARGRAIVRRLPGGLAADAAALEGVSAILSSAVAAVREGLEVASAPVEEVVGGLPAEKRAASPPPPARAPLDDERVETEPSSTGALFRPFAAALARGSTLASRVVPGGAVRLGLSHGRLRLSLDASYDTRATVTTPLGEFDLERWLLGLKAGYVLLLGELSLEPRLGTGAELLSRRGTMPEAGVSASGDRSYARFTAFAGVWLGVPLGAAVALELGAEAAFAPRKVRFVTESGAELDSLSRFTGVAAAGLVFGASGYRR